MGSRCTRVVMSRKRSLDSGTCHLVHTLTNPRRTGSLFVINSTRREVCQGQPVLSGYNVGIHNQDDVLGVGCHAARRVQRDTFSFLRNLSFSSLSRDASDKARYRSLARKRPPVVQGFPSTGTRFGFVCARVQGLRGSNVLLGRVYVITHAGGLAGSCLSLLAGTDVHSCTVGQGRPSGQGFSKVHITAVRHIGKLRFGCIFVTTLGRHIIPLTTTVGRVSPVSRGRSVASRGYLLCITVAHTRGKICVADCNAYSRFLRRSS